MVAQDVQVAPASLRSWKKDAAALGLLVILVLPLRLWLIHRTEVTARDSIGYIRYALEFEKLPWQQVLQKNDQHPGYSIAVLAVSQPVRWASGQTDAITMQRAVQVTSLVMAILLLVPMYCLGCVFFDRRIGFGAALLFQYLPISGQHLSDGLSETLFLVLASSALLLAVLATQRRAPGWFAACGLCSGLAYLTRPEGAMVVPATALGLLGMQLFPRTRLSWPRFAACAMALLVCAVAIGSVYVAATGRITNKISALQVLEWLTHPLESHAPTGQAEGNAAGGPLFATLIAKTFPKADRPNEQFRRTMHGVTIELCNGFHYVGVIPALLGLAWSARRLSRLPGTWVVAVYCMMHVASLVALAMTVSYVSDRHVMIVVLCGSYLCVAGLVELPRRVLAWFPGQFGWVRGVSLPSVWASPTCWSVLLLVGFIGFCLPKTLRPLHANRVGNHAAGLWLAKTVRKGDIVADDHCWSHYFAEQVFAEGKDPALPPDARPTCYVVVTRSRDVEINQGRQQDERKVLEAGGRLVYRWPEDVDPAAARVVVYAQPRDPAINPWRTAATSTQRP